MRGAYPIVEIFRSIQGEGGYVGEPVAFVRFGGCNLRCAFCDERASKRRFTAYAADEICHAIRTVTDDQPYPVILTGGEPLQHVDVYLASHLLQRVAVQLRVETNGTAPSDPGLADWLADNRVHVTVSPKPGGVVDPAVLAQAACLKVLVDEDGPIVGALDTLVAGAPPMAGLVFQPVTPHLEMGNLRPIDEGQLRKNARRAIQEAQERLFLGERWRVIPQVHKWIGVR